jgi:uncharacterized protein (TIGR04255 family)
MGRPRPLQRPPIKEALIDVRIAADASIDAARLQPLRGILAGEYPQVDERREMRAELRVQAGGTALPSVQDLGFNGLFFKNADGHRIAQFRRDGFTLNQLPPYPEAGADLLIGEALRLWEMYRNVVRPPTITRVAFRYINAPQLPYAHGDDLRRFLTTPPDVPPEAPQMVSAFLSRISAQEEDDRVIITQKMDITSEPGDPTPLTLDIDVYREADLSPEGPDLELVLRRLRELKNRVFFALLTDEALDLFQ